MKKIIDKISNCFKHLGDKLKQKKNTSEKPDIKIKNSKIKKRKRDENREIGIITYSFLFVFILLLVYLGIYTQYKSADLINNPYNKRQAILEEKIIRGDILSRDGEVLATTKKNLDDVYQRIYPYGSEFAHVVGYSTRGNLGIESTENFKLLECNDTITNRIRNDLEGKKNKGDSAVTTLDTRLQDAAYNALEEHNGAVVCMNARTGEILASISKPDFDPNYVNEDWDILNSDEYDSPLLNRAFLGLYPPGSTFKIVTALEYIKEHGSRYKEYAYDCYGAFKYQGSEINCYRGHAHGELDFNLSFAKSCNSSFANIASTLNREDFANTCDKLLFNSELPLPLTYAEGKTTLTKDSPTDEVLQTAIGQGKTLCSPAQICLITAAIANDGILMKPYLVSKMKNANGKVISKTEPEEYGRLMDKEHADILKELMRDVALEGTATRLRNSDKYISGGKTGSAEYTSDKSESHAWFTGYAQRDDDVIVVTVIVEAGGTGADSAVPIAKRVFDAYFN